MMFGQFYRGVLFLTLHITVNNNTPVKIGFPITKLKVEKIQRKFVYILHVKVLIITRKLLINFLPVIFEEQMHEMFREKRRKKKGFFSHPRVLENTSSQHTLSETLKLPFLGNIL